MPYEPTVTFCVDVDEQPLELVTVRVIVFVPADDQFTVYGPTPEPDAIVPLLKSQV